MSFDLEKSKAICEAESDIRNELWVIACTATEKGVGSVQDFDAACDRYVAWAKALALTEIERLREALTKIANMERMTFAECSDAEFIISTAREALGEK